MSGDQATASVLVAVPVARAFEVFTREIDLWWRRGPRYRMAGRVPGMLVFEAGAGGRLFESLRTPEGERVFERGRIIVWEPPTRLVFRWHVADSAPTENTEVEVTFEPVQAGTRVTVCHRGWAAIRADHPARHGLAGTAFSRMLGLWWGDLMSALREYVAEQG